MSKEKTDIQGRFSGMEEQIKAITGKGRAKSFSLEDAKEAKSREAGLTSKGRARFTTMLRPDIRARLEAIATNKAISIADVIETIILEYFDEA